VEWRSEKSLHAPCAAHMVKVSYVRAVTRRDYPLSRRQSIVVTTYFAAIDSGMPRRLILLEEGLRVCPQGVL